MSKRILIVGLLNVILIAGCGDAHLRRGKGALNRGEYQRAVAELSEAAIKNPYSAEGFRELGVACFHTRKFEQAIVALERSRSLEPNDGRTLFFLGFSHEQLGNYAEAIRIYGEYRRRTLLDPMSRQLQARISRLALQQAELEVRQAIAQEQDRTLAKVQPNTLAVLYFRNVSERKELNPLLKGLTSILITDLGKVRSLRLVERAKLETLLREIEMSSSEVYDRVSAPRAGRILGAARVVIGGVTTTATSLMQVDAGIIQSATSVSTVKPVRVTGRLSDILQLEKQLVFGLIEQLEVRLSETEREEIQKLPTESTLAFVSFCRGLDYADSLRIPEARQALQEAVRLDPGFEEARRELETLSTPVLATKQFLELAALDPLESSTQRHLDATAAALNQGSNGPLIPPAAPGTTGTVIVTGRIK